MLIAKPSETVKSLTKKEMAVRNQIVMSQFRMRRKMILERKLTMTLCKLHTSVELTSHVVLTVLMPRSRKESSRHLVVNGSDSSSYTWSVSKSL